MADDAGGPSAEAIAKRKDEAVSSGKKYTSMFPDVEILSTDELLQAQTAGRAGEYTLIDCRSAAEQRVSIIPGAVTKESFENTLRMVAEVVAELEAETEAERVVEEVAVQEGHAPVEISAAATSATDHAADAPACGSVGAGRPALVPYCTIGYRSGVYARELKKRFPGRQVRNGEGILLWVHGGGGLASLDAPARVDPTLTTVHTYGQPWALTPPHITAVHFTAWELTLGNLWTRLKVALSWAAGGFKPEQQQ